MGEAGEWKRDGLARGGRVLYGWMDKFDRCRPFDGYWPREIYVFSYRV